MSCVQLDTIILDSFYSQTKWNVRTWPVYCKPVLVSDKDILLSSPQLFGLAHTGLFNICPYNYLYRCQDVIKKILESVLLPFQIGKQQIKLLYFTLYCTTLFYVILYGLGGFSVNFLDLNKLLMEFCALQSIVSTLSRRRICVVSTL